jgi:hypothetical protein
MSDKENPWQPGRATKGKQQADINGEPSTLNGNQSLGVEFTPPPDDPVAERAYSQLTFKQLTQGPRLFICQEPLTPGKEIERDCQAIANHYGYPCFIADPDRIVLAYREPQ